jgi:formylglycine-generating enzyme required for sulfatase activity
MFDYVIHAIVRILDAQQRPVGAGCLVRERLIVTCAHVIADALGIPRDDAEAPSVPVALDFPFAPESLAKARVVLWWPYRQAVGGDRRHDLAILELPTSLTKTEQATVAMVAHDPEKPVWVYGFPANAALGDVGTWIEGRVTPPLPNGWLKLVQRDQQARFIEPGCSGGPVVADGRVVGIVSLRRSGPGPPEAYGISATLIREARDAAAGVVTQEEPVEDAPRPEAPEPAGEAAPAEPAPAGEVASGAAAGKPAQPRIFLAHAKEDKPQIRQLYADLKARDYAPWLDEIDLVPGQIWPDEIERAIREAGLFLACLSSRSAAKQGFVQSEFQTALTAYGERPPGSIWLIPVKLDDCEIPDLEIPGRGKSLRHIHWVDLDKENGFEKLVVAIKRALGGGASSREPGVIDVSDLSDAEGDTSELGRERGLEKPDQRPPPPGILKRLQSRTARFATSLIEKPSRRLASMLVMVVVLGGTLVVLLGPPSPDPPHPRPADDSSFFEARPVEIVPETALTEPVRPQPSPGPATLRGPGDEFRDCDDDSCPLMVVVPAGSFLMGSPEGEGLHGEGPQREVTIAEPFAIGKYEVTFEEWDACVADGGCGGHKPNDRWGRGRQPVINVSWNHADAYVSWLSERTGEEYRLPSEAEWEYAARAGTTTRYSWGDEITPDHANYGGNVGRTTEVGSYAANPWGLHHMHGNVWEWVEDCLNETYEGAPEDGSAWTTGNCSSRVVRGGSWDLGPGGLRSARRFGVVPGNRNYNLGFRVARTLTP